MINTEVTLSKWGMGWLQGHLLKEINPVTPPTNQDKENPLLKQNREFFPEWDIFTQWWIGPQDKTMQRRHIHVLNLEASGS